MSTFHRNIRTALVTGATRGLGRALTLALARRGVGVYATGRSAAGLEALAAAAKDEDLPVTTLRSDVTSPDDNAALGKRLAADGVQLDLLVHNASMLGPRVELADYPLAAFDAVIATNLRGVFDLTQNVLPHLGDAALIQIVSSGVGNKGIAKWGAYSVSKFGAEAIGQILAQELAPRDICVQVVDPGAMRTDMRAEAYPDEDPRTLITPEQNVENFFALAFGAGPESSGKRFRSQAL